MDFNEDNRKVQLPYYLTQEKKDGIEKEIKKFPHVNYYTNQQVNGLLQGDAWSALEVYNRETLEKKRIRGILLSNSCDMSLENRRYLPRLLTFAPIISLPIYIELLKKHGMSDKQIKDKANQIRNQNITNIFYLPNQNCLEYENIAMLDDIHTMNADYFHATEEKNKIFTLSNVGFYIFVFKLSVHFCRFHETIDRDL